jgi:hypothetical protein
LTASGLFFFHTPKAAGTAIGRMLSARFAAAERCPLIENTERDHQRRAGDYSAYRGYRYFGGHYGFDIFSQVAEDHLPVTNFREPLERLYSLYRYFRFVVKVPDDAISQDDLYPVVFAQRYDFQSFVATDDPRIEVHTRNHQVRQLSGSAWSPGSPANLPQAMRLLDRMPWYYLCAYPAVSQLWAQAVFGENAGPIARDNITKGGRAPGTRVVERRAIAEKNALDAELYRAAERRLLGWARACAASQPVHSQGNPWVAGPWPRT